jgi:transposase-like protein
MAKRSKGEWRRPEAKQRALERMRSTPNISELAKTLGIPRRTLYSWRDKQLAKVKGRKIEPQTREQELEQAIRHLKEALAERTLDLDFFKGALQKIEERRQPSSTVVGSASTTKSGN